jgi:hypothetical protein
MPVLGPLALVFTAVVLPSLAISVCTMVRILSVAALVAAAAPSALAWGAMGHETVAYIASNFVKASTKTYFQSLLGDTSGDYLASVASWADSWRYTTEGAFSASFHYIDALDNPPTSCDVDLERDCGDACVVSSIANYTTRLLTPNLSTAERQIAAKVNDTVLLLMRHRANHSHRWSSM